MPTPRYFVPLFFDGNTRINPEDIRNAISSGGGTNIRLPPELEGFTFTIDDEDYTPKLNAINSRLQAISPCCAAIFYNLKTK